MHGTTNGPGGDPLERAAALDRVARTIEESRIMTLHRWMGHDVWDMPRADACRAVVAAEVRRLGLAVAELAAVAATLRSRSGTPGPSGAHR
ncbi:MAG: hypothetical protein ACO35E_00320 [Ilumatobacteraceae bacterium]